MGYNIDNFDNRTTLNWNFQQFCLKLDVYDSPEDVVNLYTLHKLHK